MENNNIVGWRCIDIFDQILFKSLGIPSEYIIERIPRHTITRKEARDTCLQILYNAEQERLNFAEQQASIGFQYNDSEDNYGI
jgi:hypothetical protein